VQPTWKQALIDHCSVVQQIPTANTNDWLVGTPCCWTGEVHKWYARNNRFTRELFFAVTQTNVTDNTQSFLADHWHRTVTV